MERSETEFKCENSKIKKVLISIPNRYWVHIQVMRCALLLSHDQHYRTKIIFPKRRPYENNLNHIVKEFKESGFDYWLSIDVDNPPLKNPLDLISYDKDIIGLPTPIWHYKSDKKGERPIYWNAYDYNKETNNYKEHKMKEGLQKVDAIGTGCFLLSRRVFENSKMLKGPFLRQWLEDGTVYKGNDLSFCERARAEGFEIWCHYDYPCDHFYSLSMNKVIAAFKNYYERT